MSTNRISANGWRPATPRNRGPSEEAVTAGLKPAASIISLRIQRWAKNRERRRMLAAGTATTAWENEGGRVVSP